MEALPCGAVSLTALTAQEKEMEMQVQMLEEENREKDDMRRGSKPRLGKAEAGNMPRVPLGAPLREDRFATHFRCGDES